MYFYCTCQTFVKALILLRNKNLLTPTALLELFFELLRCQDKALRDFLQSHIVSDIKNVNAKRKNMKLNSVSALPAAGRWTGAYQQDWQVGGCLFFFICLL